MHASIYKQAMWWFLVQMMLRHNYNRPILLSTFLCNTTQGSRKRKLTVNLICKQLWCLFSHSVIPRFYALTLKILYKFSNIRQLFFEWSEHQLIEWINFYVFVNVYYFCKIARQEKCFILRNKYYHFHGKPKIVFQFGGCVKSWIKYAAKNS